MSPARAEVAQVDVSVIIEVAIDPDRTGGRAVVGGEVSQVTEIDVVREA
jgi:hypothetical protein